MKINGSGTIFGQPSKTSKISFPGESWPVAATQVLHKHKDPNIYSIKNLFGVMRWGNIVIVIMLIVNGIGIVVILVVVCC